MIFSLSISFIRSFFTDYSIAQFVEPGIFIIHNFSVTNLLVLTALDSIRGLPLSTYAPRGRGRWPKCVRSKGGCVNLLLQIWPKCVQGGRGCQSWKICVSSKWKPPLSITISLRWAAYLHKFPNAALSRRVKMIDLINYKKSAVPAHFIPIIKTDFLLKKILKLIYFAQKIAQT